MIGGLRELKRDDRDIKFGSIFELGDIKDVPDEFDVCTPLVIKDQKDTDYCSCFAGTAVSEDQELIELDPLYQYFKTKQIEGNTEWGADLRSMAKSFVKFGSIEKKDSPFNIDTPRDTILDPKNWMPSFDVKARQHKKDSYAFVSGQYDFFDNIRLTLWKNKDKRKTIATGIVWDYEWTHAPQGIIDFKGHDAFGHAFKVFGVRKIKDKLFIKAQLSNGQGIGDNGVFYFSREIINQSEKFGGLSFTDLPIDTVRYLQDNGYKISDLLFTKYWLQIKNLFRNIL